MDQRLLHIGKSCPKEDVTDRFFLIFKNKTAKMYTFYLIFNVFVCSCLKYHISIHNIVDVFLSQQNKLFSESLVGDKCISAVPLGCFQVGGRPAGAACCCVLLNLVHCEPL